MNPSIQESEHNKQVLRQAIHRNNEFLTYLYQQAGLSNYEKGIGINSNNGRPYRQFACGESSSHLELLLNKSGYFDAKAIGSSDLIYNICQQPAFPHTFVIAFKKEEDKVFLVDNTFCQFIAENGMITEKLSIKDNWVKSLYDNGYIELTPDILLEYLSVHFPTALPFNSEQLEDLRAIMAQLTSVTEKEYPPGDDIRTVMEEYL